MENVCLDDNFSLAARQAMNRLKVQTPCTRVLFLPLASPGLRAHFSCSFVFSRLLGYFKPSPTGSFTFPNFGVPRSLPVPVSVYCSGLPLMSPPVPPSPSFLIMLSCLVEDDHREHPRKRGVPPPSRRRLVLGERDHHQGLRRGLQGWITREVPAFQGID